MKYFLTLSNQKRFDTANLTDMIKEYSHLKWHPVNSALRIEIAYEIEVSELALADNIYINLGPVTADSGERIFDIK